MRQKLLQCLAVVFASVSVACLLTPVFAEPPFWKALQAHYTLDEKFGKCNICHAIKEKEKPNEHNLNVAGKDFHKNFDIKILKKKDPPSDKDKEALKAAFAKFDVLDSDGDGATNGEEFALNTMPADAKSTPEKAALEKFRKDAASLKKDDVKKDDVKKDAK